jgi:hypothetical protein
MGRVLHDAAHRFFKYARPRSSLVNTINPPCAILVLHSVQMSAGIAGKDFGEIRGLWPETANAFPTADPLQLAAGLKKWPHALQEDALVALAGRLVKWTRLAVQQQRFETDSNADQVKPWCFGIAASICALSTPID